MPKSLLVSWLGTADINNLQQPSPADEPGPMLSVLKYCHFDELHLLIMRKPEEATPVVDTLQRLHPELLIRTYFCATGELIDPIDFEAVCRATEDAMREIDPYNQQGGERTVTFFVTPGTPIMIAVFCLIAENIPGVALIQHSRQNGTRYVPWRLPDLLSSASADRIKQTIGEDIPVDNAFAEILRNSPCTSMKIAMGTASRFAKYNIRVLLLGESGTGKELVARAIHKASGRTGKFVAINCGAIPPSLAESELFGYEKGAFTGAAQRKSGKIEEADQGTLFLDEIGELPLEQQVKLLRFLQEGEITPVGATEPRRVDVRVVAATHRDLPSMIRDDKFRLDLFYRLAVVKIKIPPLRERGDDILKLAELCLRNINKIIFGTDEKKYKFFDEAAKRFMLDCEWRGNYRELENTIFQAHFSSRSDCITLQDIEDALIPIPLPTDAPARSRITPGGHFDLEAALAEVEKGYIIEALKIAGGNKTRAAHLLGWKTHHNLTQRMEKYGLTPNSSKP